MADGDAGRPVDGRAARWAGQRAKRRAEIVAAALAEIEEHGTGVVTERIAARAGIARPRLYRHFADAEDLYEAIAQGAADLLIGAMTPVLTNPTGTGMEMITRAVRTFVVWLSDHVSLYRYVILRSVSQRSPGESLISDVRTAIGTMLRDVFAGYLRLFDCDPSVADSLAFAVVGMVESTTARWLAERGPMSRDELVEQLSVWVWALVDNVLRALGVTLGPDVPLPVTPS